MHLNEFRVTSSFLFFKLHRSSFNLSLDKFKRTNYLLMFFIKIVTSFKKCYIILIYIINDIFWLGFGIILAC